MEVETESMYSALAKKELYDCKRGKKRRNWELLRSKDCKDSFTVEACNDFFPTTCCAKHRNMIEENLVCSREKFDALKCCVCVAKNIVDRIL